MNMQAKEQADRLIERVLPLWPAEWDAYWDTTVDNPTICASIEGHAVWVGLRSNGAMVMVRHFDAPFTFPCNRLVGELEEIIPEMRRWVRDREPRPFKDPLFY